ncbi:Myb-like_DNA-binding domain-containing protein [Hexamita inflata]|uniref:Myb-like DNA-binding domain-containing protein n=1 Tax=Hexamita inflata TaxID=28002 RepID=A0AA86QB48_9EUKA|nr:Myb-like DNA-binding domain-containing protein [Hexamita inflata]CAI9954304.1 Myb-like DNA-binding domain-containing protein [Hexamita inflata]CAI9954758.1 Myb-like DNA-binding domain-containing protein [Hexamita inflata]CAI9977621.1 Myb-like DNA-binding domain-containing protein [Hexamita inflata]
MKPRSYRDLQNLPDYQPQARNEQYNRVKWDLDESARLLGKIQQLKNDQIKVNWVQLAKDFKNRHPWSLFNKYLECTDTPWTKEEEERLGTFWEKNRSRPGFKVEEAEKIFKKHHSKMIKFKLEQITRNNRFKPRFWIQKEDLYKVETI